LAPARPGWGPAAGAGIHRVNGDRNPGPSVENAIEQVAAAAWQELLPDQADPPVFVQHFQRGRYGGGLDEPADFMLVRFTRIDPLRMRLGGVQWEHLSVEGLAALVGRTHARVARRLAGTARPAGRAKRRVNRGGLDAGWQAFGPVGG
jgi:hypothetical protein